MVIPVSELETSDNAHSFETFYHCWLIHQEHHLEALLQMIQCNEGNELRCKELIEQVLGHYRRYYEAKKRMLQEDVFLVLSPNWLSSFERTHLWIGGFKPALAFSLVINNISDLTQDQSQRMGALMAEIKEEENELADELTNVQQEMEAVSMVELARHLGRVRNGSGTNMESTIEMLTLSLEVLIEAADYLRKKTVRELLDILTSTQGIRFLADGALLQHKLHCWGMQRDAENQRNNTVL